MLGCNESQAHRLWVGLILDVGSLEKRFLRSPHQPLQIGVFFCILGRARLFLDLALCTARFFIFFFQLLDPLSIAFG